MVSIVIGILLPKIGKIYNKKNMDITEIQGKTKIVLQPFDNNRRLRICLIDTNDGANIHVDLSRDTVRQLAVILHSKELERVIEKYQKRAT